MSKLILVNDLHISGARSESEVIARHQRKFFWEVLFPYMDEQKINRIIILGDLFERRKYVNFKALHYARESFFDPLKKKKIKVDLICGNHDLALADDNKINSPSLLLNEYTNINQLHHTKPTEINYDGCWIGLMPWINNSDESKKIAHNFLKSTQCPIVMGHWDVKDGEMMPGVKCEDGLSPDLFNRFELALSGHYHGKSQIGNVTYLGTQYDMDWSDYGQQKFFHVLDTKTHKLEAVENPHRLFTKLEYDNGLVKNENITGKIVKLIIKKKDDPYALDVCCNQLRDQNPESLTLVDLDVEEITTIDDVDVSDVPSVITKHVSGMNHPDEFKSKLTDLLITLHTEAKA